MTGIYKRKPFTEEHKKNIGKNGYHFGMLGKHHSEETKRKIGLANLGKKPSLEICKRSSEARKGQVAWNKGLTKNDPRVLGYVNNMAKSKKNKPWTEARRKAQPFIKNKPIKMNGKEYHPEWKKIRRDVYRRDNWTCQECGVKCHGNGEKDKIQCHHIDYDVKNNDIKNLITLCSRCHGKTNYKRTDWIRYFKNKMEDKKA